MPAGITPPPSRSKLPAADHLTLFDSFQEAWKMQMRLGSVPESEQPLLRKSYPQQRLAGSDGKPPFDHRFDVILYHLVNARPGGTEPDGEGRVPLSQWYRRSAAHPGKTGYRTVDSCWWEWVTVQFDVLSKSSESADDLAYWFHRFLMYYGLGLQFFAARGIEHFHFVQRLEDRKTQDYGQELFVRPLQYRMRLQLIDTVEDKQLEQISIAVNGAEATVIETDG